MYIGCGLGNTLWLLSTADSLCFVLLQEVVNPLYVYFRYIWSVTYNGVGNGTILSFRNTQLVTLHYDYTIKRKTGPVIQLRYGMDTEMHS